jgi:hypothetical protein
MTARPLAPIQRRFANAYRSGHYAEAAGIAREGATLAARLGDEAMRVRFRFWEGENYWYEKNVEAATAALSEAAEADSAAADPIDIFNAISTLTTIAIAEKPLAEARALLTRGREHLERHNRQGSRHMLDLAEGNLAARRGDWPAALEHYRSAYDHAKVDTSEPRFTTPSYLIKLAEACFRLGDADGLVAWREAIDECPKELEGDHLRAEQARLLCLRAGLPGPTHTHTDPGGVARRLLRWLEEFEGYRAEYAREALHVLLLVRDWLSAETWLDYPGIGDDPLIRGDLSLARAREDLGLPSRDLEWRSNGVPDAEAAATRPPTPAAEVSDGAATEPAAAPSPTAPQAHPAKVGEHLAAARAHYESKRAWAEAEDRRLETEHHGRTLAGRLEWVAALAER